MKTEIPGVHWYVDCEPRAVQLEAMARSYTGLAWRDARGDPLPTTGRPLQPGLSAGPFNGFGHFLQMRLGKTPLALNELVAFNKDFGQHRGLVVSPASFAEDWGLEAVRFGLEVHDLPVHVFKSGAKGQKDLAQFVAKGRGLIVVYYEALAINDNIVKILEDWLTPNTLIVADESVQIKNHQSVRWPVLHEMAKKVKITRPMTGKPIVQGPHDLYTQLRFGKQLEGVNYFQFRARFCKMGGFKGRKIVGGKDEERLRGILNAQNFVASRADWSEYMAPDQTIRKSSLNAVQAKAYKDMEEEFTVWLDSGDAVTIEQAISKHCKLQQISSGFVYDEYGETRELVPFTKVPKYKDLVEMLENEISGKTLVMAYFKATVQALKDNLGAFGAVSSMDEDLTAAKNRFNHDPSCRVMVAQETKIKYGHTLRGTPEDPCYTTVYFENSYSLDDRTQSMERNQGIDQAKGITVIDLVSTPAEARVVGALHRKEEISTKILRG